MRELCQTHTQEAIDTLLKIMRDVKAPKAARVKAAEAILDRGWGKPAQAITGEDGGPLAVVIQGAAARVL